jgi:threonine/homoserine/homoserine lactone efflux protein
MPDYLGLLARSFLLGLAIAAPVGPTSMTAIRRGLATGAWAAFWIGMGAALTDFAYIAATYLGFTPVLSRVPGLKTILYAAGAVVLGRIAYGAIRDALAGRGVPIVSSAGGEVPMFTILAVIVGVARARIEQLPWLFRTVGLLSGLILLGFAVSFAIRGIDRIV